MRHRTPTWRDDEAVWAAFADACARHLDGLRGVLPERVIELAGLPGVDDGLIVEARYDPAGRALRLTLRCGDLQRGYFDLVLDYRDVRLSPDGLARLEQQARGPGDLNRQEVDALPGGRLRHSLEFHAPGGGFRELAIDCAALAWRTLPRPDRARPAPDARFSVGPTGA